MRLVLASALVAAGLSFGAAPAAYACQPDSPCPKPPWCGTALEKYLGCVRPY